MCINGTSAEKGYRCCAVRDAVCPQSQCCHGAVSDIHGDPPNFSCDGQVEEETNLKTDNVRLLREVDTAKSRLAELEKENELLLKQLNDKVDAAKANTTDPLSGNIRFQMFYTA